MPPGSHPAGVASGAERGAGGGGQRARGPETRTVVLVEGLSDRVALEVLAERTGRELMAERVVIVRMGGVTDAAGFLEP